MLNKRLIRLLIFVSLVAVVSAACGQKPGVHLATRGGGLAAGEGGGSEAGTETGSTTSTEGGVVSGGGASGGGASGGGTTSSGGSTGGGGSSTGGGTTTAKAGDKDGVFPDKVLIGLHAPLTGAAPVPLGDLKVGVNIYDKWLESKGVTTHGRRMQVEFADDQYSPSRAVEVCRDFVEKKKVFALIGAAGTDQIVACARYANQKGVPFLSGGVTENVVRAFKNYFAISASYPGQERALAEMVFKFDPGGDLGGKVYVDRCDDAPGPGGQYVDPFCRQPGTGTPKVAVVFSDTDGFHDARDKFLQQWKAISGTNAAAFAITKFAIDASGARNLIQQLKPGGFDVVHILTSPVNWTTITREAEGQQYAPRWVGVGLTKAINAVAATGCGQSPQNFTHSLFLHPWPSVDGDRTAQFAQAWPVYGDRTPYTEHDIGFGLWGLSISVQSLLLATGQDLSRSKFISTVENLKNVKAPSFPPTGQIIQVFSDLSYSPANHFGAAQAHLLRGECAPKPAWLDVPGKQFVTGF